MLSSCCFAALGVRLGLIRNCFVRLLCLNFCGSPSLFAHFVPTLTSASCSVRIRWFRPRSSPSHSRPGDACWCGCGKCRSPAVCALWADVVAVDFESEHSAETASSRFDVRRRHLEQLMTQADDWPMGLQIKNVNVITSVWGLREKIWKIFITQQLSYDKA